MKKKILLFSILSLFACFSFSEDELIILPDYFIKGESENIRDSLKTQKIEEEKQNKDSVNLETNVLDNKYYIQAQKEKTSQSQNYLYLSLIWSYIEGKYSFSKEDFPSINAYLNRIYLKENWESNIFNFSLNKENRFFELKQFYGKANFSNNKTTNYFGYLRYQDIFSLNENISLKPNFSIGYYSQENNNISNKDIDFYGDIDLSIYYKAIQFNASPYFYKKNIGIQANINETEVFNFVKLWAVFDKDGIYPSFDIDFSEGINKKINSNIFLLEISNKPFVEKESFVDYLSKIPTLAISSDLLAKYPLNFNTKFIFENLFSSKLKFFLGYNAQYAFDKNFYYYNMDKSLYDIKQVTSIIQSGIFNFSYSYEKYGFENNFVYSKSKVVDEDYNGKEIKELSYSPEIKNYFSFSYSLLKNLKFTSRLRYETLIKDENEKNYYDLINLDAFCKWEIKKNIALGLSFLNILDLDNNIYQEMPRSKFFGLINFEIYF